MSVTEAWVAGREAVVAFESFCLSQRWVFVEVPGQSDFGKDGYVDIVEADGTVSGSCFAVQVKGGRSHVRSGGYVIDGSTANRQQWAASTMPVIGIAFDPGTGFLYWVDLTELLNREGLGARLFVPSHQHLGGRPETSRFAKYIDSLAYRQSALLNLVAEDSRIQASGVRAAYRIGRSDGRALVLLRKVMFTLDEPVLREAVWALASAGPHPDLLGSTWTQVDRGAEAVVTASMRWSLDEVDRLLRLVGEGGFARGSFGQHVHQILVRSPDHQQTIFEVAVAAGRRGDDEVASWALLLCVAWAGPEARSRWEELIHSCPELKKCRIAEYIDADVREFGYVTLG
ncbi:MAG: DUF4365 domain-containing protein [Microthrixaceae bacterium]|nr:DUF4365 domain-containing protein [Microthrixaceae bacterium]